MITSILRRIVCLVALFALSSGIYGQDKMYLIKNNKVVATYGVDDVDFISFDWDGSIKTADFEIKIDNIEHRIVEWTVTPSDPDMYYYTAVGGDMDWIEEKGSAQAIADDMYNAMQFVASMAGVDIETFMETQVLAKGTQSFGYDQVGPGSNYTIFVFGCNPEGEVTTEMAVTPFSTPEMPKIDFTAEFDAKVDGTKVELTVTPSDNTVNYVVDVRPASEAFDAQSFMNNEIWKGSVMGRTPEECVALLSVTGVNVRNLDLDPNTEYQVNAMTYTSDGIVNSDVSSTTFTTGSVATSEMTFDVTLDEINTLDVTFTITPSNDDVYTRVVVPAADIAGKTDQEILELYANQFMADYNSTTGTQTFKHEYLSAATEYSILVFGYSHYTATTGLTRVDFTTAAASDPSTWVPTFENIVYDGNDGIACDIKVNQQDVAYIWNCVDENATVEQIAQYYLSEHERYVGMGINYAEMRSVTGDNTVTVTELEHGARYRLFAFVMSPEDGSMVTDCFFSPVFTLDDGFVSAPAKAPVQPSAEFRPLVKEPAGLYKRLPRRINK